MGWGWGEVDAPSKAAAYITRNAVVKGDVEILDEATDVVKQLILETSLEGEHIYIYKPEPALTPPAWTIKVVPSDAMLMFQPMQVNVAWRG